MCLLYLVGQELYLCLMVPGLFLTEVTSCVCMSSLVPFDLYKMYALLFQILTLLATLYADTVL